MSNFRILHEIFDLNEYDEGDFVAKQKYYVVWVGRKPGIFMTWPECQKQINKFYEAKYKSFSSKEEAEQALMDGWERHWGIKSAETRQVRERSDLLGEDITTEDIDMDSISVDVGCSGNPGIVEYKGVDTKTGEILFYHGPILKGTNNLGEFIAIVHGLAYLKKEGSNKTIYSDSKTALSWLKRKQVGSTLERNHTTKEIWELTDRAIKWLQSNTYENKVLKWHTEVWGEIKADFGRK